MLQVIHFHNPYYLNILLENKEFANSKWNINHVMVGMITKQDNTVASSFVCYTYIDVEEG